MPTTGGWLGTHPWSEGKALPKSYPVLVDDGVNTPEYGGRVNGCFLLLLGPSFGRIKHNMTTQNTMIMISPTITIAIINSGLSVTGSSVSSVMGTSATVATGVTAVAVETGIDVLVVVGWSDDVVVVSVSIYN